MKLNLLGSLLLLLTQFLYASDDQQSWTEVSMQKKIPFSLRLELAQGLRLKDYVSELNQAFFELSISYKDSNGFRINIPYRYTIFEDKRKHRLTLGVSYQYSIKPVSLKNRIKYYRLYENRKALGDLFRNKFTIKYKTGEKTNPYIAVELFYLLSKNNNQLDEYRASCGIEIDLPRKNSINIFYILKKEDFSKTDPENINVFGLSYALKL